MKVFRHKFLSKYPIIIVDKLSNWANGIVESELHYQKVKIKGRPLTYIVIDSERTKEIHGKIDESVIGATVALIGGSEKYPMNPKLAMRWAIERTIEHDHRGAYSVLTGLTKGSIVEGHHVAFQMDEPGGDFGDEDEFERLIDQMDDEIDGRREFVDENIISELVADAGETQYVADTPKKKKKSAKRTSNKPAKAGQATPDRKQAEKRNAKKGDQAKTGKDRPSEFGDGDPRKGYIHVAGGDGNLYIKDPSGNLDSKKAQALAKKNGADARYDEKANKMVPLSTAEKDASKQGNQQAQQQGGKKAPAQGQNDTTTVDMVDTDSKEYRDAKNKGDADGGEGSRGIKKKTAKETSDSKNSDDADSSQLLNSKSQTGQDKSVDQQAASTATESDYFTGNPDISNQEFESKNEDHWLNGEYRLDIPYDLTDGRMPKREVDLLYRLANTTLNSTTKSINHFSPNAGAGQIASQAGELCMQYFASIHPDEIPEARKAMIEFLKENGNKGCLTTQWVEAAANNVMALHDHLRVKFGEGNYEIQASAWDTKDGVEALIGRDIHTPNENGEADKGYSTDVFFTVKGSDGEISMLEVSLKQDLTAKLFNGGPQSVFKLMADGGESMKGSKLDPAVSVGPPERKNVVDSVSNGTFADALELARKRLKSGNMDGITSDRRNDLKSGMEKLTKLLGKNFTPEDVLKALKNEGDTPGSDIKKLAWKVIYGVHEISDSKKVKQSVGVAKKIYSDYSENWVKEYSENEEFRTACDTMIKQRLPLVDVMHGGEIVIAGRVSIDRATMKEIFGVSDPKQFVDGTKVFGPPEYEESFIGYYAKGMGDPIPIAKFRARAESLGYGNRIKVDMDIHSDFRNRATEAHRTVYGVS